MDSKNIDLPLERLRPRSALRKLSNKLTAKNSVSVLQGRFPYLRNVAVISQVELIRIILQSTWYTLIIFHGKPEIDGQVSKQKETFTTFWRALSIFLGNSMIKY